MCFRPNLWYTADLWSKTILTVFGVYLPFDDRRILNNELYLEVTHELQGYVDHCGSPCMIVGDFNTRLPQDEMLSIGFGIEATGSRNEV